MSVTDRILFVVSTRPGMTADEFNAAVDEIVAEYQAVEIVTAIRTMAAEVSE